MKYPKNIIVTALNKAAAMPRPQALEQKESSKKLERPIVPLTYHPHTVPIRRIIRANWHTLAKSKDLQGVFEQPPLFAFKRDRNLRDMLVHAALHGSTSPPGTFPCGKQKCKSCPFLAPCSTDLNGPNGSFNIKYSFNCQNNNVVYALVCSSCSKIYIGETYRRFEVRIGEHLADISHKRTNRPVAAHFCQENHSISDLQALCVW